MPDRNLATRLLSSVELPWNGTGKQRSDNSIPCSDRSPSPRATIFGCAIILLDGQKKIPLRLCGLNWPTPCSLRAYLDLRAVASQTPGLLLSTDLEESAWHSVHDAMLKPSCTIMTSQFASHAQMQKTQKSSRAPEGGRLPLTATTSLILPLGSCQHT